MSILVTGGAGYVGSHICLDLLQSDNNVTVVDSLENSTKESLLNISKITNIYKNDCNNSHHPFKIFFNESKNKN